MGPTLTLGNSTIWTAVPRLDSSYKLESWCRICHGDSKSDHRDLWDPGEASPAPTSSPAHRGRHPPVGVSGCRRRPNKGARGASGHCQISVGTWSLRKWVRIPAQERRVAVPTHSLQQHSQRPQDMGKGPPKGCRLRAKGAESDIGE